MLFYKTSGANEIIFEKFLSLSSLAIGPKTLFKYTIFYLKLEKNITKSIYLLFLLTPNSIDYILLK